MKVAVAPLPLLAALAVVVGATAAVSLSLLSTPAEVDQRMSQIRTTTAQVQRLNSQPGSPGVLPLEAVCRGSPAAAAATYKAQVVKAAAGRGVPVGTLTLAAPPLTGEGQFSPLNLSWKGTADYIALMGLLSDLETLKPVLFVDALDIKASGSLSQFELKGRLWCWTPADTRS